MSRFEVGDEFSESDVAYMEGFANGLIKFCSDNPGKGIPSTMVFESDDLSSLSDDEREKLSLRRAALVEMWHNLELVPVEGLGLQPGPNFVASDS